MMEEMEEVFLESQKEFSKKGKEGTSGEYHGSHECTEIKENFSNSNNAAEGAVNAKIQNLPDILHDTWKLHKAFNNL
jgi:hypothetical protein